VQRSIRYFTTIDRAAGIQRMVATGRGMKLPGLRRFLAQGLGIEVDVPESYRQMTGADVLSAPAFKENCLCFPVCYGLALQGMNRSAIRTNLVPGNAVLNRVSRGLARAGRWIATGFQRVGDRTPKRAKPATIAEHETRPCARCRKAYSAKMNSCPHCGAPLAQAHKPAEQAATVATASHLSGRKPEQITDAQIMAFQAVRADGNMTIHFRCPVCGDTFQFAPNETAVQTASDLLEEGGFTITCQCKRELRMRAAGPEMIVALNAVVSRRGGVSYLS
jgi:ribosomal protein L37E